MKQFNHRQSGMPLGRSKLTILGIETSCDETAASVIEITDASMNYESKRITNIQILSNIVSSQVKIHAQYGGIVPEVAARQHAKNIIAVLAVALKELGIRNWDLGIKKHIDAIAVTSGPGLITSLLVGIEAAKTLAFLTNKPLIPVNHLLGHIYSNFINIRNWKLEIGNFLPAVCLVVSGGHTELVLMRDFEKFQKIGQTLDDAAGECFDKVAKILGLGYPGGPAISEQAQKWKPQIPNPKLNIRFPRPMLNSSDFNFSFSGLKTAVLYKTRELGNARTQKYISTICHEAQQAIIDVLIDKTIKAAKKYEAKSIILGGGVVANKELRKQMEKMVGEKMPEIQLLVPELKYTTDNAAMIAAAGYFKLMKTPKSQWAKKFDWRKIKIDPNLSI